MFASTVLNYMDRQTVSLVERQIRTTFTIRDYTTFGWVLSSFMLTYALFQVPAGYLVDRWDMRWSYPAAVAGWSLAAVATAAAPSLGWLIVGRALLGVGESFNWPCALRVTARVLPPRDRSLGNGIFNSGAAVGAVLTPIVVAQLTPGLGWRITFLVIGAAGFVWVAVWLLVAGRGPAGLLLRRQRATTEPPRTPPSRARLSPTAGIALAVVGIVAMGLTLSAVGYGPAAVWVGVAVAILGPLAIAVLLPASDLAGSGPAAALAEVVRLPRFWTMIAVSISINICWHFLVNWIPTYLKSERHLAESVGNYLSAVIYLAADAGNLAGGWLSRWLATRADSVALGIHHSPPDQPRGPRVESVVRARKLVMTLCMILILSGPAISLVQSDYMVLFLLSLMAAGTAAFMANFFAFSQEVSSRHTGLVVGYLGAVGNLFVAGYQPIAGSLRDATGSFTANFLIVGLAPLAGIAAILWGWRTAAPDDLSDR
jgi:ACS family hexuronate transporter-like MFS transporter